MFNNESHYSLMSNNINVALNMNIKNHLLERVIRVTCDVPSTNLVLKRTFALLNISSLSETITN
jgi:hypothetical protein